MVLEDRSLREIAEAGAVTPYDPAMVQPSSIDLKLGESFRRQSATRSVRSKIDLADIPDQDEVTRVETVPVGDPIGFYLWPGECALGSTLERICVPEHLVMCLDGKSSLGRLFLIVHATAGYFDPGFEGVGTLELVNLSRFPIVLRPGLPICQSRWMSLAAAPEQAYRGRYQGDEGAVGSRYLQPIAGTPRVR